MRERSLLFNGRMVRAILEDRKTQTRRPVLDRAGEPPPNDACFYKMHWHARAACFDVNGFPRGMHWSARLPCVPGDRFVVRESIATIASGSGLGCDVRYVADGERRTFDPCPDDSPKYRPFFERQTFPSIHMPRWAARLVLPVLRVWVEPLNQLHRD
jgi:hypothetical protein